MHIQYIKQRHNFFILSDLYVPTFTPLLQVFTKLGVPSSHLCLPMCPGIFFFMENLLIVSTSFQNLRTLNINLPYVYFLLLRTNMTLMGRSRWLYWYLRAAIKNKQKQGGLRQQTFTVTQVLKLKV